MARATAILREWLLRLLGTFRPQRSDADLRAELESHLDLASEYASTAPASTLGATRRPGWAPSALEAMRDQRSVPWLEDLGRDLGHSWRGLRREPTFALGAIATLAIGIGSTSALSTVAYSLLLKPLPFSATPDRLVQLMVHASDTGQDGTLHRRDVVLTSAELESVAAGASMLDGAGLVTPTVRGLAGVEGTGRLRGAHLSLSALALLDTTTVAGRTFAAGDEARSASLVVLSHRAWLRYFGGDPAIVGRTLQFETVLGARRAAPADVLGVMAESFTFPDAHTDFWMLPPAPPAPFRGRLLARLAAGATPEAAAAEVGEIVRALHALGPTARFELAREQDELVAALRPLLTALIAAAFTLLVVACVNVAALCHARALTRHREFVTRAAVGASRGRLVRQCLTESLLVGTIGGVLGLLMAAATVRLFRTLAEPARLDLAGPAPLPRLSDVSLDERIAAVTLLTSIAIGALVGMAAAIRASRATAPAALRARASAGPESNRGRQLLVVGQVAGAMTLLVAAALTATTVRNLLAVDAGYDRARRFTFQVTVPASRYDDARLAAFAEDLVERLQVSPSIVAAAYANQLPLVQLRDTGGGLWTTPDPNRRSAPDAADARYVSRDYLGTMGIPVRRGRGFGAGDDAGQPRVLLVNEALVDQQFLGEDPIGRLVYIGRNPEPWTIVGVVANVRQFGLQRPPEPQFFVDLRQWAPGSTPRFPVGPYFVVTTRGAADGPLPAVRAALGAIDPSARLFNVSTMDGLVQASVARPRLLARVMTLFATIAALLAAVGVYGVVALQVTERRREIGVRFALGATAAGVLRMIAAEGAGVVALGIGAGILGALASARVLDSLLYGVTPRDPWVVLAAGGAVSVAAMVAIVVPARRATRVDPAETLRCE